MYVGSAQARAVIREYEFFFPKNSNKIKKKKYGQTVGESKKETKFDVLLTSYEMINMDSASLKPIKWECMVIALILKCVVYCLLFFFSLRVLNSYLDC